MRAGRLGSSPAAGVAWMRRMLDIDIRHVLPAVRVPTLVIHAADDRICPIENSHDMAGEDPPVPACWSCPATTTSWWLGPSRSDPWTRSRAWSPARPPTRESTRVLATVLFTDIVDSARRRPSS